MRNNQKTDSIHEDLILFDVRNGSFGFSADEMRTRTKGPYVIVDLYNLIVMGVDTHNGSES